MDLKQIILLIMMIGITILQGCSAEENESMAEISIPVFYEEIQLVSNPEDPLVLVNKNKRLEAGFTPGDLVIPRVLNGSGVLNQSMKLRQEAAVKAEALFEAALFEAGIELLLLSGYRSYELQTRLYNQFVESQGQAAADRFSARPGHSEHQTGLALDVSSKGMNGQLTIDFSETEEGRWLRENAARFGFIIRYPQGRESETGFMYEPWHIRYVGLEAALVIFEKGLILEEFLIH
jgi:LAS superfamily LD-carboxypeptidase LdcB